MANEKHVLVIGLGRFGLSLVETLWEQRAEITVIDQDERAVAEVQERSHAAFVADATDVDTLEAAGAPHVDAAVVTFGESFEPAVLCVAALRKWKIPLIVARAATKARAEVLRTVGATRVYQVEQEMGQRAALAISAPVAPDLLDFASQYHVLPWTAHGPLVGRALADCGLRPRFGINVLGVRPPQTEGGAAKLAQPSPDTVIEEGSTLLLVGEDDNIQKFVEEMRAG